MYYVLVAVAALLVGAAIGRWWPLIMAASRPAEPSDRQSDACPPTAPAEEPLADQAAEPVTDQVEEPAGDPEPETAEPSIAMAAVADVAPAPVAEPITRTSGRDPQIDVSIATVIIAVADRLTSLELRRRLFGAIRLMPDMTIVAPASGDRFDQLRHEWIETRAVGAADRAETVAEVLLPGVIDLSGRLMCTAKVAVFDTEEE